MWILHKISNDNNTFITFKNGIKEISFKCTLNDAVLFVKDSIPEDYNLVYASWIDEKNLKDVDLKTIDECFKSKIILVDKTNVPIKQENCYIKKYVIIEIMIFRFVSFLKTLF